MKACGSTLNEKAKRIAVSAKTFDYRETLSIIDDRYSSIDERYLDFR